MSISNNLSLSRYKNEDLESFDLKMIQSYEGDLKEIAIQVEGCNPIVFDRYAYFGYWICNKCREITQIGVKSIHKKACTLERQLPARGDLSGRMIFGFNNHQMIYVLGKKNPAAPYDMNYIEEILKQINEMKEERKIN